ncbi:MAG TPA: hypothetical protein VFP84_30340 [Kofleriaceae bacterium]|nr:hypothetical protein [Kofleriaceae bacterium]
MSGQAARNSQASALRVRVLPGGEAGAGDGDGDAIDVFEVVGAAGPVIRVRAPLLFEVGEDLHVRIDDGGRTVDATVRVRGHAGGVSELEVTDGAWP